MRQPDVPFEIKKFTQNEIPSAVAYFKEFGFVVFTDAFEEELAEGFWSEVENEIENNPNLTFSVYGTIYKGNTAPLEARRLPRIIDIENYSPSCHKLMLGDVAESFLTHYYGERPTCLQTLTYKYSSEQGAHSDKTLVSPPYAPGYNRDLLTASWFAIEDADENNGALIIYPKSHLFPKRPIQEFEDYGSYMNYCDEVSKSNGCYPISFIAKAGDILFWHSDFIHAGGAIANKDQLEVLPTRRSLVCHYAALKPGQVNETIGWTRERFGESYYFRKLDPTA